MSNELYKLPAGVNLPAKYKKTINSRRLFIVGAQDAITGIEVDTAVEAAMRRHQGNAAWQAYKEGHEAGTKARVK